jgi:prepilin peptidase CpaA
MPTPLLNQIPRLMIGASAMGVSLLLLLQPGPTVPIALTVIYLLVICATDTLFAKIPNLCNIALILTGLTYQFHQLGWAGAGRALLGFGVGFSLLLLPYLAGGIGGGDVKALAALGTLFGPGEIFQVFLYSGLFGGIFAILHYLFQKNLLRKIAAAVRALLVFFGTRDSRCIRPEVTDRLRFPYATAFAFGIFCYLNFGTLPALLQTAF